jgi:hypothetical protein
MDEKTFHDAVEQLHAEDDAVVEIPYGARFTLLLPGQSDLGGSDSHCLKDTAHRLGTLPPTPGTV